MKNHDKYIMVILFTMMALTYAAAQENTQHLMFKQTEIMGNIQTFYSALKEKGFNRTQNNTNELTGQFAGHEVIVSVNKTCISETVYQVCAKLKPKASWNLVELDYNLFKKNLTTKYGEPAISKERFIEPYRKGDGFEQKAVSNGKVEYVSCWILPQGEIIIQIIPWGKELMLLIRYADAQGNHLNEKEKTELFLQDL